MKRLLKKIGRWLIFEKYLDMLLLPDDLRKEAKEKGMNHITEKQDQGHHHHLPVGSPALHTTKGIAGINTTVKPSGTGCLECLAMHPKGGWLHLRRCAECGHVGCCNSSPNTHAQKHYEVTGHPIIQSFEPGEEWFYSYPKDDEIAAEGITLAEPHAHPKSQPVPYGNLF